MKTLCGLAGYQTLPSKYKISKETTTNPLHILPPRPRVPRRSFSFSESKTSNNSERTAKQDVNNQKKISRSGSQYLSVPEPSPKTIPDEFLQPLSRSLSLASLQPGHGHVPPHAGPHGTGQVSTAGHAGIWSRGRRTTSCRNLTECKLDKIMMSCY